MRSQVEPMTEAEVLALPVAVDLKEAARALGIGRTRAQEMARNDRFPVRVLKVGRQYKVARADLLKVLGIDSPAATG